MEETIQRMRVYFKGERAKLVARQYLADNPSCATSTKARAKDEAEVVAYCVSIGLTENDGIFFWCRWESGSWFNAGKRIRDWKMVIRQWQAAGWCPSQKQQRSSVHGTNGDKPMTTWEINEKLKVINKELGKLQIGLGDSSREPALIAERNRLRQLQTGVTT
jgi:hypothetical protein